jgi:predicted acyltransferase
MMNPTPAAPITAASTATAPSTSAVSPRILSIDILRGLTIGLMIVVNDAGDGKHAWWPLEHAAWNGWTPTDLVFPTFLFLVGCSIVFSTAGRIARGEDRRHLALHVLRRSVIILLLDWFIALFPHFHLGNLRFYGVLTRIALCYLCAGLLFLRIQRPRTLVLITATLLIGYWLLMRFVPVPGFGTPTHEIPILDPDRNLVAWLDRHVVAFTQHYLCTGRLYEKVRDPEGLLSTLPSIATTLIGVLSGLWMRSAQAARTKFIGLFGSGVAMLAAGLLWSPWFPINKKLWTSSYVLLAAGLALIALGLIYWLLDVKQANTRSKLAAALIWPWQVFGSNAIAAYAISELVIIALGNIHVGTTAAGRPLSLLAWIYQNLFARNGSTELTSHTFALVYTLLCFLPIWFLWRKRIFLRI